jgi:hypothetical protein
MFQGIQELGEVWQVVSALSALGPEALPKVIDGGGGATATREVIFIHGGGIVMRCIASGTERAVRRLEYVYGAKVGAVVKVELVDCAAGAASVPLSAQRLAAASAAAGPAKCWGASSSVSLSPEIGRAPEGQVTRLVL